MAYGALVWAAVHCQASTIALTVTSQLYIKMHGVPELDVGTGSKGGMICILSRAGYRLSTPGSHMLGEETEHPHHAGCIRASV